MNFYEIDYEFGRASFYTAEADPGKALREFVFCASECFGIRKSVGETKIVRSQVLADPPEMMRRLDATHALIHSGGDNIFWDRRYEEPNGDGWKLLHESGKFCMCAHRGYPDASCPVHGD